ncbi:I78 family peptidase inhibitor [Cognatiluteimonas lumbrici]|uniref:I78 family peptidase inhibitor n=1 Tax=Cognatiluteimonas lumbrici TaxID=2559601 RepID=UPI0011279CB9|nr:I78 family peptidase inhibitor [Luteimonas lumbrici]
MDRTVRQSALVAVVFLGVAACASQMPPPPNVPIQTQCVAGAGAWAVGRAPTDEVVEQVRVDTRSNTVRVIHPGQAVTMDYRGDRVNIKVNERNAIVGVSCG